MWCYFSICANFFKIVIISVPRALKRLCAKHRASAEAEVRENALHSATMFWGKGGGVQKCGTRAKFCEMLGVWGKVFRKIRFACFLIFWRDFGGQH